jgi:hypothetical protein
VHGEIDQRKEEALSLLSQKFPNGEYDNWKICEASIKARSSGDEIGCALRHGRIYAVSSKEYAFTTTSKYRRSLTQLHNSLIGVSSWNLLLLSTPISKGNEVESSIQRFTRYRTHVILYVQETGAEGLFHGTESEIRGTLTINGVPYDVSVDLPERHDFSM